MFGNKRLAKRSIIGTRVSALWSQDGRFYPANLQSQISEDTITSSAVYAVRFDDGFTQHVKARNIIGQGFQSITNVSNVTLLRGQKIFITLNGREVSGTVLHHDRHLDEVQLLVKTPTGEEFSTICRLEDVRLLESRKSARLESHQDTDYSKLNDLQLSDSNKKRISSHVIDVPSATTDKNDRQRRHRHLSDERDSEHGDFDDVEMMDETIAAMVLTSLSVSPKSPTLVAQHMGGNREPIVESHSPYTTDTHLSSSVASSGFYSGHSERDDHSPPLPPLSESAPAIIGYKPPTPGSDDDSSNSSGRLLICEEDEESTGPIQYRCTWRGCDMLSKSHITMERHIRRAHFDRDSDLEMTDNEEEFHYTEVDETSHSITNMTKHFAALNTSASLEDRGAAIHRHRHASEGVAPHSIGIPGSGGPLKVQDHSAGGRSGGGGGAGGGVFDHDYQRKMFRQNQVSSEATQVERSALQSSSLPISIDQGQIQKSLSWQIHSSSPNTVVSPPSRQPKLTPQERLYQHQAQSPKSNISPAALKITQHRRPRSEVRKCRKVYGMDHRDQWCTQCKWKKACTRFID